jgi:transcriptional regulator with XRE-family HTH domain
MASLNITGQPASHAPPVAPKRPETRGMAGKARGKKDAMLARDLGARLRKIREARFVSQRELAKGIRIETAQISRYERGLSLPSLETLVDLCRFLQVGLEALVLGKEGTAPPSADPPIQDISLLERFRELEKLKRKDRETVIELIDAWVGSRKIEEVVSRLRRSA